MPTATPTRQRPSPSPSPSSSRSTSSSSFELLYNTAVQAFVRRDHIKSISTLLKLLDQLQSQSTVSGIWYNLDSNPSTAEEKELEIWKEKISKLYISATVSLYSDPKAPSLSSEEIGEDIPRLLPPASPDVLLTHLQRTCQSQTLPSDSDPKILQPSLVSTLLLASLKLQPAGPALDFAHKLAEDWLAALPDQVLHAISQGMGDVGAGDKKKVEGIREGYLKITELFVGEVLVKEGEFEMGRAFLEGEEVMGSKRKENLYRHIRSAESRPRNRSNPSSPSSSMTLPSPSSSGILPSKSTSTASSRNGRSRTSSVSSSSSEATARPSTSKDLLSAPTRRSAKGRERPLDRLLSSSSKMNGKPQSAEEADDEKEAASHSTESSLPSKLYVNHSPGSSTRGPLRPRTSTSGSGNARIDRFGNNGMGWETVLAILPKSLQVRLRPIISNPWLLAAVSIPIPLITLLVVILGIRRKILKKRNELVGRGIGKLGEVAVAAGQSTLAVDAMADVRARLKGTRARGVVEWFRAWLGWWLRKFGGVWRMATTITYL